MNLVQARDTITVEWIVNRANRVSQSKNPTWIGFHVFLEQAKGTFTHLKDLEINLYCSCALCQMKNREAAKHDLTPEEISILEHNEDARPCPCCDGDVFHTDEYCQGCGHHFR
jgi:hypothetical protein